MIFKINFILFVFIQFKYIMINGLTRIGVVSVAPPQFVYQKDLMNKKKK